METKTCTKCKEIKPATLEYFTKHSYNSSGLQSWCKICVTKKSRIQQQTEEYKEYAKIMNASPKAKQAKKNWITRIAGVYSIKEDNVVLYVGQSKQFNQRKADHKYYSNNPEMALKMGIEQYPLYVKLNQHNNLKIELLEECPIELLLEKEKQYINRLKPKYNKYGFRI